MEKVMKRQITCIFLYIIFALFVAPQLSAQDAPPEVIQVAEEELPYWLSLITPSSMEEFGFSEDDDLDDAVLGRPFLEYLIHKREVLNYREGHTIYDVLTGSSEWCFPIMIGDESKCILKVTMMDNNWDVVAIGGAIIAKWVGLARKVWPISEGYDPLFVKCWTVGTYYFSVPQVDVYNLTQLDYYPIESEEELALLYQDLRPLSETMEYIALHIDVDYDEYSGIGFDSEGGDDGGCFISTAKGGI